jgi:putative Mg2+ transporter-C (MgtC) family protein
LITYNNIAIYMPESEMLLRLGLSFLIGGAIGLEREYLNKSAGFRTMIMICMGSCLFTLFSMFLANATPDRIASNIVTGIGFLGAGVIFKEDNRVKGLTTAAAIWVTAALGMGIGGGYYFVTLAAAILSLMALLVLTRMEGLIDRINQNRTYKIVWHYKVESMGKYEEMLRQHKLKFRRTRQNKSCPQVMGIWIVNGKEKNHNAFIKQILHDDSVIEFEF